jgi:uncharacterized membrane-anchored protein
MSVDVARHQWDEALRRIEQERAPRSHDLAALVETVQDELRRRVGQTFTLAQLADAYTGSEDGVREVVADAVRPKASAGVRDSVLVGDAAFGRYARGAADYAP